MSDSSDKGKSRTQEQIVSTNVNANVTPYLMKFMSDPTDFSGDIRKNNPLNWIKKIERIKTFGQLDDRNILLIAVDHLVDQASCWFNITHPDPDRLSWEEFKTSFMTKYCSGRKEIWWEEINSMRQGPDETVEDVEIRMRELYQLVGVKDETMIKRTFLKAIKPEIALEVERADIEEETDLLDIIKRAIKAERFLKKYQLKGITATPKVVGKSSEANYNPFAEHLTVDEVLSLPQSDKTDPMSELIREFRDMKVSLLQATNKSSSSGGNKQYNNSAKKPWACFYCKEEGHRKVDCPKYKRDMQEGAANESGKDRARQ